MLRVAVATTSGIAAVPDSTRFHDRRHRHSRPATLAQLRDIAGIGDKKLEHYGDELIALVKANVGEGCGAVKRDKQSFRACRGKRHRYSITSSARPSSEFGTVRPSVLAVLRLRISSTFVACCTGRSEGFSPLRIRPV